MPQPQLIGNVSLPTAVHGHIKEGKVEAAIDPQRFAADAKAVMQEVGQFVAKLKPSQRQVLLDALRHSLDPGHGASVSFSKQKVGYKLDGLLLSVTDATVTEDNTTGPVTIRFYQE